MNTYKPFQRTSDMRWDFACENDGHTHPVGYCSPYREWWLRDGERRKDMLISDQDIEEYKSTQQKHHSNGHATAEEAAQCYRDYLLDHRLQLIIESPEHQMKCVVCGTWTNLRASIQTHWSAVLCNEHNNRKEVEKLFNLSGGIVIWSSY